MDPGPTPTLMPSAPASSRAWAPALVATLPPITSVSELALTCATMSSTACEWPCAVSTTRKSTPTSVSACARSLASSPTPTAAPTTSRPAGSLVANGNFSLLVKSFTVISPRSRPASSTSGRFSARGVRAAGHRMSDHAGLGPLDHVDLLRLLLHGQVAVQDADTALAGHGDRHPGLGDGIHRRRQQRHAQLVAAGDPGRGVRLAR